MSRVPEGGGATTSAAGRGAAPKGREAAARRRGWSRCRARALLWAALLGAASAPAQELTLAQALTSVRRDAIDPAVARARLEQAEGRRRAALAALLPKLEVSAAVARYSGVGTLEVVDPSKGYTATPLSDPAVPPGSLSLLPNRVETLSLQPQVALTALGQLTVPVLNLPGWARLSGANRRAEAQALLAERAERATEVRAWQLLLAARASKALVALGGERVRVAREQEQAAEARFRSGELDRLALARARVATAAAERVLRQLEVNELGARAQVGALLGRDARFEVGEVPQPPALEARLPAELDLAQRADLRAARDFERASAADTRAAWLRLAPELDANAQFSLGNVQNFSGENVYWVVQARGIWHLFDGGERYGELRERRGLEREAGLLSLSAQREAQRQVVTARQQVDASKAALVSAQTEVRYAKESLEAARAQFRVGQLGYLELLDAQSTRFTAEEAQVNEALRLAVARLELALAVGDEGSLLEAVAPR